MPGFWEPPTRETTRPRNRLLAENNMTGREYPSPHILASPPGTQAPAHYINYTPDTNEVHAPGSLAPQGKLNYSLLPHDDLRPKNGDMGAGVDWGTTVGPGISNPGMSPGSEQGGRYSPSQAMRDNAFSPGQPPIATSPYGTGPGPQLQASGPDVRDFGQRGSMSGNASSFGAGQEGRAPDRDLTRGGWTGLDEDPPDPNAGAVTPSQARPAAPAPAPAASAGSDQAIGESVNGPAPNGYRYEIVRSAPDQFFPQGRPAFLWLIPKDPAAGRPRLVQGYSPSGGPDPIKGMPDTVTLTEDIRKTLEGNAATTGSTDNLVLSTIVGKDGKPKRVLIDKNNPTQPIEIGDEPGSPMPRGTPGDRKEVGEGEAVTVMEADEQGVWKENKTATATARKVAADKARVAADKAASDADAQIIEAELRYDQAMGTTPYFTTFEDADGQTWLLNQNSGHRMKVGKQDAAKKRVQLGNTLLGIKDDGKAEVLYEAPKDKIIKDFQGITYEYDPRDPKGSMKELFRDPYWQETQELGMEKIRADIEKSRADVETGKIGALEARSRIEKDLLELEHPKTEALGSGDFIVRRGGKATVHYSGGNTKVFEAGPLPESTRTAIAGMRTSLDEFGKPKAAASTSVSRTGATQPAAPSQTHAEEAKPAEEETVGEKLTPGETWKPGWPGSDPQLSGTLRPPSKQTTQSGDIARYDEQGNLTGIDYLNTAPPNYGEPGYPGSEGYEEEEEEEYGAGQEGWEPRFYGAGAEDEPSVFQRGFQAAQEMLQGPFNRLTDLPALSGPEMRKDPNRPEGGIVPWTSPETGKGWSGGGAVDPASRPPYSGTPPPGGVGLWKVRGAPQEQDEEAPYNERFVQPGNLGKRGRRGTALQRQNIKDLENTQLWEPTGREGGETGQRQSMNTEEVDPSLLGNKIVETPPPPMPTGHQPGIDVLDLGPNIFTPPLRLPGGHVPGPEFKLPQWASMGAGADDYDPDDYNDPRHPDAENPYTDEEERRKWVDEHDYWRKQGFPHQREGRETEFNDPDALYEQTHNMSELYDDLWEGRPGPEISEDDYEYMREQEELARSGRTEDDVQQRYGDAMRRLENPHLYEDNPGIERDLPEGFHDWSPESQQEFVDRWQQQKRAEWEGQASPEEMAQVERARQDFLRDSAGWDPIKEPSPSPQDPLKEAFREGWSQGQESNRGQVRRDLEEPLSTWLDMPEYDPTNPAHKAALNPGNRVPDEFISERPTAGSGRHGGAPVDPLDPDEWQEGWPLFDPAPGIWDDAGEAGWRMARRNPLNSTEYDPREFVGGHKPGIDVLDLGPNIFKPPTLPGGGHIPVPLPRLPGGHVQGPEIKMPDIVSAIKQKFGAGQGPGEPPMGGAPPMGAPPMGAPPMGGPPPGGGGWEPPVPEPEVAGIGHRFGQPMNEGEPFHSGVDLQAQEGAPTVAPADGIVEEVRDDPQGLGLTVIVRDAQGMQHKLGHLKSTDAYRGMVVAKGQNLAQVGSSGNTTGSHLHWAVRDQAGQPQDPTPALGEMGGLPPVPGTEMMGPPGGSGSPPGAAPPGPMIPPEVPGGVTPPMPGEIAQSMGMGHDVDLDYWDPQGMGAGADGDDDPGEVIGITPSQQANIDNENKRIDMERETRMAEVAQRREAEANRHSEAVAKLEQDFKIHQDNARLQAEKQAEDARHNQAMEAIERERIQADKEIQQMRDANAIRLQQMQQGNQIYMQQGQQAFDDWQNQQKMRMDILGSALKNPWMQRLSGMTPGPNYQGGQVPGGQNISNLVNQILTPYDPDKYGWENAPGFLGLQNPNAGAAGALPQDGGGGVPGVAAYGGTQAGIPQGGSAQAGTQGGQAGQPALFQQQGGAQGGGGAVGAQMGGANPQAAAQYGAAAGGGGSVGGQMTGDQGLEYGQSAPASFEDWRAWDPFQKAAYRSNIEALGPGAWEAVGQQMADRYASSGGTPDVTAMQAAGGGEIGRAGAEMTGDLWGQAPEQFWQGQNRQWSRAKTGQVKQQTTGQNRGY